MRTWHTAPLQVLVVLAASLVLVATPFGHAESLPTVRVVIMSGPEADGMKEVARQYTEQTGNPVEIIEQGRDTYLTLIPTQLLAGTSAFDLAFIQSTMVGELADAGAILPLDGFLQALTPEQQADVDLDDILVPALYEGQIFGLPTDISTYFAYYRSDLIPQPPETWDEVLDLARQFSRSQNPDSPTRYGLAFDGLVGQTLPEGFYSVMWSYGGQVVDEDGIPAVDQPQAVEAAAFWQALAREELIPPEILSMGFSEVLAALEAGQVAMAIPGWNAMSPIIRGGTSPHRDVIEEALLPGVRQADGTILRTPYTHSYFFALNSFGESPDAAMEFLLYATGKEGSKIYALAGGMPSRVSILNDEELIEYRPEFPLMSESLEVAVAGPPLPYWPEHIEAMNTALASILNLSRQPEEALAAAARAMEAARAATQ